MRHRRYQVGYAASVVLLLAAAVVATVLQRFFVAAIVPGIAFALAARWFRRKARTSSEPAVGLARVDVQVRIQDWDAPELSGFKSHPRALARVALVTPGTIGCFLDVGPAGIALEPSPLMRLIGLSRTAISWTSLDRVDVHIGRGPLGNSVVLLLARSGGALVARYASDVDFVPTLAAAAAASTNPGIPVEEMRPESPTWQAW